MSAPMTDERLAEIRAISVDPMTDELVDEVERLRTELARRPKSRLGEQVNRLSNAVGDLERERDRLAEQVKRVRALSARLRAVDEVEEDALANRIDAALEDVVDLPDVEAGS